MTLKLAQRPAAGNVELLDLTYLMPDWTRSAQAIGGYWKGSGVVAGPARDVLIDHYNSWIGRQVIEYALGMECWRGYVSELRLTLNGVEYFQSLEPGWFGNYVTVFYSSDIGTRSVTSAYQTADSITEFGRCERNIYLGGTTAVGADAIAQVYRDQFGWPRSRMAGGLSITERPTTKPDGLQVTALGFWHTLNWRHKSSSTTQGASVHIADVVSNSEFVETGEVDSNTLSVRVDCYPNPCGWADVAEDVTRQGDSSNNLWKCGVYEGRKLSYQQSPTTIGYYLRNGQLYDAAGGLVVPELIKPGFLLRSVDAPTGRLYPGASLWDDPQVSYIEAVTYDHGARSLLLQTQNVEEGLVAVAARIATGGYGDRFDDRELQ